MHPNEEQLAEIRGGLVVKTAVYTDILYRDLPLRMKKALTEQFIRQAEELTNPREATNGKNR